VVFATSVSAGASSGSMQFSRSRCSALLHRSLKTIACAARAPGPGTIHCACCILDAGCLHLSCRVSTALGKQGSPSKPLSIAAPVTKPVTVYYQLHCSLVRLGSSSCHAKQVVPCAQEQHASKHKQQVASHGILQHVAVNSTRCCTLQRASSQMRWRFRWMVRCPGNEADTGSDSLRMHDHVPPVGTTA
jgi:hypothetical protein